VSKSDGCGSIPVGARPEWPRIPPSKCPVKWMKNGKGVSVHTMKAFRRSRGIASLIINIFSRWL